MLVGGGHSHVQVLRRRMMRANEGGHLAVTLIAREVHTPYSGMLPSHIAGFYESEEMHIDLSKLCRAADARLVVDEVVALDLKSQRVSTHAHPDIGFDLLSLNSGAVPGIEGVEIDGPVTPVKPIGQFLAAWQEVCAMLELSLLSGESRGLAVVGAGAGGVELVLAIAKRFDKTAFKRLKLLLVEAGNTILPGHNRRVTRWAEAQLAAANVTILKGFQVAKITSEGLVSASGAQIEVDHTLWTTGVSAAPYPQDSGLSLDSEGFVRVNKHLQSLSHESVFAAGDMVDLASQPRPKSGVYAVRQGPILAENLHRFSLGLPLKIYRAQKSALAMLGNGRGSAVASRGQMFAAGRAVFKLKSVIDRRFMARFDPPAMETESSDGATADPRMRCAGCGSKLPANLLSRVLQRLDIGPNDAVLQGIGEDAAMIRAGAGTLCVSTDHFPQMITDTYRFGRIVAHHGMSDLFAMGALPRFALLNLSVRLMGQALMEEEAYLALKGAEDVFRESGATIIGGHSTESDFMQLGCTVFGNLEEAPLEKSALKRGDVLVLTKPLGLGVLLAGEMRHRTRGSWLEGALAVMDQSNGPAVRCLRACAGTSCTDVTGFGLLGHLSEMLHASRCSAQLMLDKVPVLDGAVELMRGGVESSLQHGNESVMQEVELTGVRPDHARLRLMMDPQTSGGLLCGIEEARAQGLVDALHEAGYSQASVIGRVEVGSATGAIRVA